VIAQPLKRVADVWCSNVDKKSVDGQIPVRLCNYTDVYYNDRIVADLPFMEATATPDQIARFSLRAGDVLLTKDSETADDIGVSAHVAEDLPGVICGYHLAIARPRVGAVDGRYLHWALTASTSRGQLEVAATGVTRFGLRQDAVAGMLVPTPGLAEQGAIADYLDAETARIDRIVSARNQQLALIRERADRATTELLQSGGAPVVALKRAADLLAGFSYESRDFLHDGDGVPLLRGINVDVGSIQWTECVRVAAGVASATSRFSLAVGDVVMGMDRPVISSGVRVAQTSPDDLPAMLVQRVARLRATAGVSQDYLYQALCGPGLAAIPIT
jgi:type I restriction enzyme S subunit